jgi:hypothetical protein
MLSRTSSRGVALQPESPDHRVSETGGNYHQDTEYSSCIGEVENQLAILVSMIERALELSAKKLTKKRNICVEKILTRSLWKLPRSLYTWKH